MKIFTKPEKFRFNRTYLSGIALFSIGLGLFITLIFFTRGALADEGKTFYVGLSVLFTFLVSVSISLGCYPFFSFVIRRFSWDKHPLKRGTLMFAISIVFPAIIISAWVYMFDIAFGSSKISGNPISSVDYFDHILIAIIITSFMVLIYELQSIYRSWRDGIVEKEKLKREAIEYQYNALTTQLDPHFLFNSLNVLSSLIRSNDKKSIGFIDRFSDLYRYILNAQAQTLVPLKQELELVEKYVYLQKLRYQNNLKVKIENIIDDTDLLVPPLSVQLLMENAIKHNVISVDNPLKIVVTYDGHTLSVENKLQRRKTSDSNGMGQQILAKRYAHLTDRVPVFEETNGVYIAKIPLINEE